MEALGDYTCCCRQHFQSACPYIALLHFLRHLWRWEPDLPTPIRTQGEIRGRTHSMLCNSSSRSLRFPESGRCWHSSAASCRRSALHPHRCKSQTGSSYRRRWDWLCYDTWWSQSSGWGSGYTAAAPLRNLLPWHRKGSGPHSQLGRKCPSSPSSAQTHWYWMQADP